MNVPNLNQESLQQILPLIQKTYPNANIKKPWIGPEIIQVPYESFYFIAKRKKTDFKLDFNPPVIWMVVGMVLGALIFSVLYSVIFGRMIISFGGAIPALIGFLIVKAIFKSKNKEKIEQFNNNFIDAVNNIGK